MVMKKILIALALLLTGIASGSACTGISFLAEDGGYVQARTIEWGDSYLPSELNAAYLWAQLQNADMINENRLESWNTYRNAFEKLAEAGKIEIPYIPDGCVHNAHMFYIKLRNLEERTRYIAYMKEREIQTVFHYVPLHSAPAGLKFGRFSGEDEYTTKESERLVRLPLYYGLKKEDIERTIQDTIAFFQEDM